jgi:geranylgeranyl diphosphate synthase type I
MTLNETLAHYLPHIEAELQDIARIPHRSLATYYNMMHYHLGWADETLQPVQAESGKRLRPILCLLSCVAAGGDLQQALPAACAVELVHNFSLVHDDIQDGSRFRRGRPAVWDLWGAAHAINVGDGLFTLARLCLHRLGSRGVALSRQHAAMQALDRACMALCEGQYSDMSFEDRLDVDLDQYLWMIRHKTATLLAVSAQLGVMIATDDAAVIEHYYCFGENLGLAFQIQDDILGTWGDEQVTGKSAASDIRDRKKTLPVVYALNHPSDRAAAWQLAELYAYEGPLGQAAIRDTLAILEQAKARQYAELLAQEYYRQALHCLDQTEIENAAQSHLRQLAASLLERKA